MSPWRFMPSAALAFALVAIYHLDPPATNMAAVSLRIWACINGLIAVLGFMTCTFEPQKLGEKK